MKQVQTKTVATITIAQWKTQ